MKQDPGNFSKILIFNHANYLSSRDELGLSWQTQFITPESEASCMWKWLWPSNDEVFPILSPNYHNPHNVRSCYPHSIYLRQRWECLFTSCPPKLLYKVGITWLTNRAWLATVFSSHSEDLAYVSLLIPPLFWLLPWPKQMEEPSYPKTPIPKSFSSLRPPLGGGIL